MDKRCVLCNSLYERFYDSNLYRIGCIGDENYRHVLFPKLCKLLNIEESGNYYFLDSLCKGLLKNPHIKEIMSSEELNIRNEHIIQKTIKVYLKFQSCLDEKGWSNTYFKYKKGYIYGFSLDSGINNFLKMLSVDKTPYVDGFKISLKDITEKNLEVFDLIK